MELLQEFTHRRENLLTGDWVLVSPHRMKRPWQGKQEPLQEATRPKYDSSCYLCPGNTRANGIETPKYTQAYSFVNDFSALVPENELTGDSEDFFRVKAERGLCKVICFSPDHSLTLPEMSEEAINQVIDLWKTEYKELGSLPFINHVQLFENKGSIMGCSNPHPHGQIWAQESVPLEVQKKSTRQQEYFSKKGSSLLGDYLTQELDKGTRIIAQNNSFVSLVPFWAVWPYEAMIIPKRHHSTILQMSPSEQEDFANILKDLTIRFDNVFECSFPYSAGIHQAPTDGSNYPEWHWHMSFFPPLLRSATVKKFMVGYEMLAEPQRDITAEVAAKTLREISTIHFKDRK